MKKLLLSSLFVFSAGTAVAASNVSYNFASVQYINEEIDEFDCDQDGLTLEGNLDLDTNLFALGTFTDVSGDICGSETFSIGAGYKADFSDDGSYYGALSYENTSVDEGESDSGLIVAVGARVLFAQDVEGRVEVSHHSTFEGNTVLSGGLTYWLQRNLSVTGDANLGSESTSVTVGVRLDF